jgi:hypothetical protein
MHDKKIKNERYQPSTDEICIKFNSLINHVAESFGSNRLPQAMVNGCYYLLEQ